MCIYVLPCAPRRGRQGAPPPRRCPPLPAASPLRRARDDYISRQAPRPARRPKAGTTPSPLPNGRRAHVTAGRPTGFEPGFFIRPLPLPAALLRSDRSKMAAVEPVSVSFPSPARFPLSFLALPPPPLPPPRAAAPPRGRRAGGRRWPAGAAR